MSLMDEYKQGMSDQPSTDYGNVNQMVDYVANLAELERPVGELKLDLSNILIGGKTLNELQEAAKRAKSIATRFAIGGEEFDIHHRRYQNEDGCYPRYAGEELREVMKVIFDHPDMAGIIRNEFNVNHYMDQVVGCMMIGLSNIFLAGAGIRIKVTKDTLNPARLFQIVNDIALGNINPPEDPQFTVLPNVEEIDAMTSVALDVFIGKQFGTPGFNGIVPRQRMFLAQHIGTLIANLIKCIKEGLTLSALMEVHKDPKWQDDPIAFGIYLSEINYHENFDKHAAELKTVLGGLSNKLIATLVEMSLINVDDGGSAFIGGAPKTYLNSNAAMYNTVFSKYIIVLASTINGDYPLSQTVGAPASTVMIDYQNQRIFYDSLVAGIELTQDYIDKRVESRVLHNTIHDYWKNDTAHTRILRHSLGNLRNRHDGAIEVILSASDDLAAKWKRGSSLTLYDEVLTEEEIGPELNSNTNEDESSKENKMTSPISQSPNAQNLTTLTSGALYSNLGKTIDVIPNIKPNTSLLLIGMSSLLAIRNETETSLFEPSSMTKIGYIHNDKFHFHSTPLGIYYESLLSLTPTNSVLLPTNDVVLTTKTKTDIEIVTTAASGKLPYELPSAIEVAVRRSIKESSPVAYNNIWRGQIDNDGYLGNDWLIKVNGERLDLLGPDTTMYPAQYYANSQTPGNWLAMLNTTNQAFSMLDEIDLAPSVITVLQRELPADDFELDAIRYMHVGSVEVAVVPAAMVRPYLNNAASTNIAFEIDKDVDTSADKFAMFTYLAANNVPTLYIAAVMEKESDSTPTPVNEEGSELFGPSTDVIPEVDNGIDALFGASAGPEVTSIDDKSTNQQDTHDIVEDTGSILDAWSTEPSVTDPAIDAMTKTKRNQSALPSEVVATEEIESDDAIANHHANVEELLDDMHAEMEAMVETSIETAGKDDRSDLSEVKPNTQEEHEVVDPSTVDLNLPSIDLSTITLKSFYGTHKGELFVGKEDVKVAREAFAKKATLISERNIALDRYIQVQDGVTADSALHAFADEHLGGIVCDEVLIDGRLALAINSTEVDLELWRELVYKLGAVTCVGLDHLPAEGHTWYLTTRYNSVMNAIVIMIVDGYTKTREEVKPVTDLTDDAPQSLDELLEEVEELEPNEVPAFAHNVILQPEALATLDDITSSNVRNKMLQAKELSKEEGNLYVVELAKLIAADRTIPRRTRGLLRDAIANQIKSITAKYYPVQFEEVTLTTHEDMATFIMGAYDNIKAATGYYFGDEYVGELNAIDVLDITPVTVVVIDESSETIGMIPGMTNVPVTSVGIDFDLDTNEEIYLFTGDEKLLKLNDGDNLGRNILSVVYQ